MIDGHTHTHTHTHRQTQATTIPEGHNWPRVKIEIGIIVLEFESKIMRNGRFVPNAITFPIVVIFFRGCVSEMVVLPYSVIYDIYISEHWDLVSIICVQFIDVQSMVFANDRIHYGLQVVFVCLQITPSHYHHYADSSEGIELIKCLSGICCRVCV